MEVNYVPTTCPYCGTGCGFNLVVKDKKVAGVAPWHLLVLDNKEIGRAHV